MTWTSPPNHASLHRVSLSSSFSLTCGLGVFIFGCADFETHSDAVFLCGDIEERADGADGVAVLTYDPLYIIWGKLNPERGRTSGAMAHRNGCGLRLINEIGHHIHEVFFQGFRGIHRSVYWENDDKKETRTRFTGAGFQKTIQQTCALLGDSCCFACAFYKASYGFRGAGAFGNPSVDFLDRHIQSILAGNRIISAKDLKKTAVATETLICSDDAVERTIFGAFAAETDYNGHDR